MESVPEDLLYVECALERCGVRVEEETMRDCSRLLSLIRKKLKVPTAFVTQQPVNRILFDGYGDEVETFIVCNDLSSSDSGLLPEKLEILQHCMRMYMGVSVTTASGKIGTLIVSSLERRKFTAEEIAFVADVTGCIDDRYRYRRDVRSSSAVSNLTICAVLLSGIKGYVGAAIDCLEQIGHGYAAAHAAQTREEVTGCWQEVAALTERLEEHKVTMQSSIDRALHVAKNYTAKNKREYFLSCFQSEPSGFTQSMNAVLLRLCHLMPDFNILWAYKVAGEFMHCAHRTFYAHLLFFLEGLVFRWAPHCSMAQISIHFDAKQQIAYRSPKHCYKRNLSRYAQQITSRAMLSQSMLGDEGVEAAAEAAAAALSGHTQGISGDSFDDNDDDELPPEFGCKPIYKDGNPFGLNLNLDTSVGPPEETAQSVNNSRIQFGYLRIIFQPLDMEDSLRGVLDSDGDDDACADGRTRLRGSPTSRTRSAKWRGSHKSQRRNNKVAPSADDGEDDSLERPVSTPKPPTVRRAAGDDLGPHESTLQLLQVMDDFLRCIDPRATACLAPPTVFDDLADPQCDAFMLMLPCYFTLGKASELKPTPVRAINRFRRYQLRGAQSRKRVGLAMAADVAPGSKAAGKAAATTQRSPALYRSPSDDKALHESGRAVGETPSLGSSSSTTIAPFVVPDCSVDLTPSASGRESAFLRDLLHSVSMSLAKLLDGARRPSFVRHNSVVPDLSVH